MRIFQRTYGQLVIAVSLGLITAVAVATFLYSPPITHINVRWSEQLSERQRLKSEGRFALASGFYRGGTTWSYELQDTSFANIRSLVKSPRVEDTHGIVRDTFALTHPPADKLASVASKAPMIFFWLLPVTLAVVTFVIVPRNAQSLEDLKANSQSVLLPLAIGGVPLILFVASILMLLLSLLGVNPSWPVVKVNLPEAAALRQTGDLLRLLDEGKDPYARSWVRPGLLHKDRAVEVDTLEAAVQGGRVETLDLLLQVGVAIDEEQNAALACLAHLRSSTAIAELLEERARLAGWSIPECGSEGVR